ncbi:MAG: C40 family peptidase, partial [Tannerella sp.]|nr:C40 family peptidase [Tannerella sp.]
MNTRTKTFLSCLVICAALPSCKGGGNTAKAAICSEMNKIIEEVRAQYAPDPRDEVCEITVSQEDGKPVLRGVVTEAATKAALIKRARAVRPEVVDSICLLPAKALGDKLYGIADVSVADLRTGPGYAKEMATQTLLGMAMHVLQEKEGWYRVRTPEGYLAWIEGGTMTLLTKDSLNAWISAPKVIYTADYGFAYEKPDAQGGRISDLVFGDLLKREGESGGFYQVAFPDGRQGYVPRRECEDFEAWTKSRELSGEGIVKTALSLQGIPYSWGGTSEKAMDCSGFAKTVNLHHGIMLRRDAS